MRTLFTVILSILSCLSFSQTVNVTVDVTQDKHKISPFIFGKNNCLSSSATKPTTDAEWQFLRDAGVRIVRENGGNNSTKYNWRKKITSHPDWYNNVYGTDWDYEVSAMQQKNA